MPEENEIETIGQLMLRAQEPKVVGPGARPILIVPPAHRVQSVECYLPTPCRKIASPVFTRAESFAAYVNDQKTEASRLYVTCSFSLTAVINHHGAQAGWQDHRAVLNLTKTPEWNTWVASHNSRKPQRDFALFIEDNSDDISVPSGAALLDLIRTIKTSQNLEVSGDIDERGDQKGATFVLATKTKAGAKGELELPTGFTLSLSPYEGGTPISVNARLRIEICAPRLVLWYELVHVQRIEKEAMEAIVDGVAKETEMTPWFGTV